MIEELHVSSCLSSTGHARSIDMPNVAQAELAEILAEGTLVVSPFPLLRKSNARQPSHGSPLRGRT